jgi:hypothetical protein
MKNTIYIFFLITLFSCNKEVSITPIEVSPSWRGTPGKLVVKKGDLVDTIYDCQFGHTPEYKLLMLLDTLYFKELNISKEIQIKDKASNYNWIRRKGKLKLVKNSIVFEMDSIITLVENDETKDTISLGRSIKHIKLNPR